MERWKFPALLSLLALPPLKSYWFGSIRMGRWKGQEREECGSVLCDGHSCELTLDMNSAQSLALSSTRCSHQLRGEGKGRVKHHSLTTFKRNVVFLLLPGYDGRPRANITSSTNTLYGS